VVGRSVGIVVVGIVGYMVGHMVAGLGRIVAAEVVPW
jgi:hypothetical protein